MSKLGHHLGFSSTMRRVPPPPGIMVVPNVGVLQMVASQIDHRWIYRSSENIGTSRTDYYFDGRGNLAKIVVDMKDDFKIPYIHFASTTMKLLERTIRNLSLPFDQKQVETVGDLKQL